MRCDRRGGETGLQQIWRGMTENIPSDRLVSIVEEAEEHEANPGYLSERPALGR